MNVGIDASSRGIAIFITEIDHFSFHPLPGTEEGTYNERLKHLIEVVKQFDRQFQHFGQLRIHIEEPSLNTKNPGAAHSSTVAIAYSYALWGLLAAGNKHKVQMVHNATWKAGMAKRAEEEGWTKPKGGVRSKAQVVECISEAWPGQYRRITEGTKAGNRQDVLDAFGIAVGTA